MIKWRPKKWGIFILALWAGLLALLTLANLLLLSASTEVYSSLGEVWWIFVITIIISLGFGLSAYGLWYTKNWGRWLFMVSLILWSGFNLLALFAPSLIFVSSRTYASGELILAGLRYGLALIFPLLYLNLPDVKRHFVETSEM
jgi:hypothetical protein